MHRTLATLAAAILTLTTATTQTQGGFALLGAGCNGTGGTCASLNPGGGTLANQVLFNEYCYPVVATSAMTVTGINLFVQTNNGTFQSGGCGVYAEDPGNPGAPLTATIATGTISVAGHAAFYPIIFSSPVAMAAGETIWVGVDTNGIAPSSTANGNPSPAIVYWRSSPQGGGSWSPTGIVKNPAYQVLCATGGGTGGATPLHTADSAPAINKKLGLMLSNAAANSAAYLIIGSWDHNLDLTGLGAPGCMQHPYPDIIVSTTTDATGSAMVGASIPNNAAMVGTWFFSQYVVVDAGANALGVAVSNSGLGLIGG